MKALSKIIEMKSVLFLVLYVHNNLLIGNNKMLSSVQDCLSNQFEMKHIGGAGLTRLLLC